MSIPMKRLLTDKAIEDVILEAATYDIDWSVDGQWMTEGGKIVRDHYERLIAEGKLRVVDEETPDAHTDALIDQEQHAAMSKYPIQITPRKALLHRLEREIAADMKVTDLHFKQQGPSSYTAHFDMSIGGSRSQTVELGPQSTLEGIERRLIHFLTP